MMPGRPAAGHPRGGPPCRPNHPPVSPLPPCLSRRPPGTRLRRSGHPGHSPHARTRQHLLLDAVCCLRRVTISFLLWRDGWREGRLPIPLVNPNVREATTPFPHVGALVPCFFFFTPVSPVFGSPVPAASYSSDPLAFFLLGQWCRQCW